MSAVGTMTRLAAGDTRYGRREVYRHGNRATACVDHNPRAALATMSIRVGGGASDDPIGRSGLAHLFEHLFFTGTAAIGRDAYSRTIADLGALGNAATSSSWIKFYTTFSSDVLAEVVALEAERFARTIDFLNEPVLEREKAVVLRERRQRVDTVPHGDALEHLFRLVYGDSAFGRLPVGVAAEVESIDLADCIEYFRRHYRAARVRVALAGNFDVDRAPTLIAGLLDAFADGGPDPAPPRTPTAAGGLRELAGPLPKIFLGYRLPPAEDPRYDEARLASYLLGKGHHSWLREHVVRDGAVIGATEVKTLTRVGVPSIGIIEAEPAAGVRVDDARDHLRTALAGLGGTRIGTGDVERACADYRRSWFQDDDTTRGRADGLSLALLRSDDADRYERELRPAERANPEAMARAVRFWNADHIVGEVVYR